VQCHGDTLVKIVLEICKNKRILSWQSSVEYDHALDLIFSTVNQIFYWVLYKHHLKRLGMVPFATMHDIGAFYGSRCFVINSLMKNECGTTLNNESEHVIGFEFSQVLLPSFVSLLIRFC